jgi:DNA-directed RNA polymerase subunit RPC12/RpoP
MTSFQCTNCKYKFELKAERTPRNCPYCGKINTVVKEKSAGEILNEINYTTKEEVREKY